MRILYIVDGRSPIALNWIRFFNERGHETHLISTFDCAPDFNFASARTIPVAFSGTTGGPRPRRNLLDVRIRTRLRQWLGPFTIRSSAAQVEAHIAAIRPDLVHAMRIPFEGMLASSASSNVPLLLSVWGNDFTLHARSTPWMERLTRHALNQASGLHVDCHRDLRLAEVMGFDPKKEAVVLPGGGGVRPDLFHPSGENPEDPIGVLHAEIPKGAPIVINPRGIRAYIRNDTFFEAIPRILKRLPDAHFLCVDMAGNAKAHAYVDRLGIGTAVQLLPKLTPAEMGQLFRAAQVAVSLSEHDGTPNTLLEAMACGCFPIAGDLEPIREWIEEDKNGVLLDPDDPEALAEAVIKAISNHELRAQAAKANIEMIAKRATYSEVMAQAEAYYHRLLSNGATGDGSKTRSRNL